MPTGLGVDPAVGRFTRLPELPPEALLAEEVPEDLAAPIWDVLTDRACCLTVDFPFGLLISAMSILLMLLLFPRAMNQVAVLARILGECRGGFDSIQTFGICRFVCFHILRIC